MVEGRVFPKACDIRSKCFRIALIDRLFISCHPAALVKSQMANSITFVQFAYPLIVATFRQFVWCLKAHIHSSSPELIPWRIVYNRYILWFGQWHDGGKVNITFDRMTNKLTICIKMSSRHDYTETKPISGSHADLFKCFLSRATCRTVGCPEPMSVYFKYIYTFHHRFITHSSMVWFNTLCTVVMTGAASQTPTTLGLTSIRYRSGKPQHIVDGECGNRPLLCFVVSVYPAFRTDNIHTLPAGTWAKSAYTEPDHLHHQGF